MREETKKLLGFAIDRWEYLNPEKSKSFSDKDKEKYSEMWDLFSKIDEKEADEFIDALIAGLNQEVKDNFIRIWIKYSYNTMKVTQLK